MEVRLHVVQGKANVKEIVLGRETLIGRGTECNLKIASSQVSRKHCRIQVTNGQVLVTDYGSANGTLRDGKALPPNIPTPIHPDEELEIGPLRFAVKFKAPQAIAPIVPSDDTQRGRSETARIPHVAPAKSPSADADTVDYVPDPRKLRALQQALAKRDVAASGMQTVRPSETVMDVDLASASAEETAHAPANNPRDSAPAVSVDPVDETLMLPQELGPTRSTAADEGSDDDVVHLDPLESKPSRPVKDRPAKERPLDDTEAFLSDLSR